MRTTTAIICALALAAPAAALAQADLHPIPGAGAWRLAQLPDNGGCFARAEGREVDTMLAVNKDDKLVVSLGDPSWTASGGTVPVTLQIEGGKLLQLQGDQLPTLVMVLIDDDRVYRRLRTANRVGWTLPTGHYDAYITGLGAAFDATRACMERVGAH
jgi:hypothetical protein